MYRGFKLPELTFNNQYEYYNEGLNIFKNIKTKAHQSLLNYISIDGILDGKKMQEDWFPTVEADVFISHSHKDEEMAIILAGWLYSEFNLKSFIDSCIWGYSKDLLKILDDKYCTIAGSSSFSYELRNHSTSHVHMMLSTALTKMIDKTECLFFLNTPNSIVASEIEEKTISPWIYSEIETSRMIRINTPRRIVRKMFSGGAFESMNEQKRMNEEIKIKYPINSGHLTRLTREDLNKWKAVQYFSPEHKLDVLYELFPIKETERSIL